MGSEWLARRGLKGWISAGLLKGPEEKGFEVKRAYDSTTVLLDVLK